MIDDPAIRRRVIVAAENVDLQKDLQLTKRLLEQERIKTETLSATILKYKTPVQLSEGGSIYKWEQRNQTTNDVLRRLDNCTYVLLCALSLVCETNSVAHLVVLYWLLLHRFRELMQGNLRILSFRSVNNGDGGHVNEATEETANNEFERAGEWDVEQGDDPTNNREQDQDGIENDASSLVANLSYVDTLPSKEPMSHWLCAGLSCFEVLFLWFLNVYIWIVIQ